MNARIQSLIGKLQLDVACITSPTNLFYLTNWYVLGMERLIALLIGPNIEPTLIVPQLEYENAISKTGGLTVHGWEDGQDPFELVASVIKPSTGKLTIGIEKSSLTVAQGEQLDTAVNGACYHDISPHLYELRQIKDESELQALQEAALIADKAAQAGIDALKPGVTEYEIASIIETICRSQGDRQTSFPPIVLSGPSGALPHGKPGDKELADGELVVMDHGGRVRGYCSDITRTGVVTGADDRAKRIHTAVLAAQERAVMAVKPGCKASDIDKQARDYLDEQGLGQYFIHRTGHGIGIDVHEPPYIGPNDDVVLEPGMTFSVEPGVYIPGWGGVRIEDIVTVTTDGVTRLNNCPRALVT